VAGTFRLESTEQAVTAEQAKELLPLWKAYRSLSGSSSSSTVELQALVKQIQGTMAEEQVTAIAAMGLTAEDLNTVAQEQGVDATASVQQSSSSSSASKTQPTSGRGWGAMGGVEGGAPRMEGECPVERCPPAELARSAQTSGVVRSGASNAAVSNRACSML